jgi:hypothetical protein
MDEDFETDLDISWIHQHEKENCIDKNYCREPMNEITSYSLYINREMAIDKVVSENITIESGSISKERLLHFIQNKKTDTAGIKYRLMDILLYNVDLEPENIQGYSKSDNSNELSKSFFKILPVFDSISVTDSIFLFHSINSIYFLFKEIECLDVKLPKSILKKYDKTQRYRVNEGIKNQTKKVIFNNHIIELEKKTDFNKTHRTRSEKSKTRKYKL